MSRRRRTKKRERKRRKRQGGGKSSAGVSKPTKELQPPVLAPPPTTRSLGWSATVGSAKSFDPLALAKSVLQTALRKHRGIESAHQAIPEVERHIATQLSVVPRLTVLQRPLVVWLPDHHSVGMLIALRDKSQAESNLGAIIKLVVELEQQQA